MIFKFTSRGKDLEQSGQDVQGETDLKTGLVALLSNSCFTTMPSFFLGVFFFSDFFANCGCVMCTVYTHSTHTPKVHCHLAFCSQVKKILVFALQELVGFLLVLQNFLRPQYALLSYTIMASLRGQYKYRGLFLLLCCSIFLHCQYGKL